jgi:predicted 3-demethylubiquinone-9 3-methyltransferase (glyoxalase superfamily)
VDFEVKGYRFVALHGGPGFKFNPSISFLVACDTKEEVDVLWNKLSQGGKVLMEKGSYPFSENYGWTEDKYGLSWQIMFTKDMASYGRITPTMLFVGEQYGKAESAGQFYISVFHDSKPGEMFRYGDNEPPDKPGMVKHSTFTIEKQMFAAMDSALEHKFAFNEAVSLTVECSDQKEIDYYWEKLIAGGGQESVCGWLKDKFGVSWQVSPIILNDMLLDKDKHKVEAVTESFLKMKKINIDQLKKAFEGR